MPMCFSDGKLIKIQMNQGDFAEVNKIQPKISVTQFLLLHLKLN